MRDYRKILDHADLVRTLDLTQPVALMLVAILHFIVDADDPYGIVAGLRAALSSGSYLIVSHGTWDHLSPDVRARLEATFRPGEGQPRTKEEVLRFFDGLELVAPGVVSVAGWRAENEPPPRLTPAETASYGAVARVP